MEQWSILSNLLNYIQHDRYHAVSHTLNIKAVNKHRNKSEEKEEKETVDLDFGSTPLKLHKEYLDVHEAIQSEIVNTTRFNENSDLSTTYLGISNRARNNKLKAEESFPISEHGYTSGKLLDGTECQLLLDTGASKSFMSKSLVFHRKDLCEARVKPEVSSYLADRPPQTGPAQLIEPKCTELYYTKEALPC